MYPKVAVVLVRVIVLVVRLIVDALGIVVRVHEVVKDVSDSLPYVVVKTNSSDAVFLPSESCVISPV